MQNINLTYLIVSDGGVCSVLTISYSNKMLASLCVVFLNTISSTTFEFDVFDGQIRTLLSCPDRILKVPASEVILTPTTELQFSDVGRSTFLRIKSPKNNENQLEAKFGKQSGMTKRAVKWTLTDINSVNRWQAGKVQSGRR